MLGNLCKLTDTYTADLLQPPKKKKKKTASLADREEQKNEAVEKLKEKNQDQWSHAEYRLWAEAIVRACL